MSSCKTALLVFFVFLTSVGLAADVAMVVAGAATAELNQETWQVEIAEMLPENVILTVAADSLLKLMHFATNKEYEIPALAKVKVTANAVEGSDVKGQEIELISGKIEVDPSMEQQTGAAYGDRHIQTRSKPQVSRAAPLAPRPSARPAAPARMQPELKSDANLITQFDNEVEVPEQPQTQSNEIDDEFMPKSIPSDSSLNNTLDESASYNEAPDKKKSEEEKERETVASLGFAVPKSLYDTFSKAGADFHFVSPQAGSILSVTHEHDWVKFSFSAPKTDIASFSGNFLMTEGDFIVTLLNQPNMEAKFSNAMALEKNGHFCQAAAMWLELAARLNLDEKVLNMHLQRLHKKLTGN